MLLRGTKICYLKKAIYGLKQSPRAWFKKFSLIIFVIEFYRCHSDHSVFVRRTNSSIVVLTIYIDDILLIDNDSARLLDTKQYFKRHFMTGRGTSKIFSGN